MPEELEKSIEDRKQFIFILKKLEKVTEFYNEIEKKVSKN